MYDSTNPASIPLSATVAAGYVDGLWPSYAGIVQRVPHAAVVPITVKGRPGTREADGENGDLSPQQMAVFAQGEINAGRRPTIYCAKGSVGAYAAALRALNIEPGSPLLGTHTGQVDWHVADWGEAAGAGQPHLLPGTVATQYDHDVGGCDLSLTDGVWPTGPAPVAQRPVSEEVAMDPRLIFRAMVQMLFRITYGRAATQAEMDWWELHAEQLGAGGAEWESEEAFAGDNVIGTDHARALATLHQVIADAEAGH